MLRSLALAFALIAAPATAGAQEVAVAADSWAARVERTAEGGYRMGNPAAPVKLVEYVSITCSHCADFAGAAGEDLRNRYVNTGQVSWEMRPYLIFPSDPGLFLLMQCAPAAHYFRIADALFQSQNGWARRVDPDALQRLEPHQQIVAAVRATGVEPVFRNRGLSDAQIATCLADRRGLNDLIANHQRYSAAGVDGTPAFFINGQRVQAGTWAQLEPLLAAASRSAPRARRATPGR